jgi:hypothetical protein
MRGEPDVRKRRKGGRVEYGLEAGHRSEGKS